MANKSTINREQTSFLFNSRRPGSLCESFRIVLPLVLAMGANAINQFADRIFLARYSDVAIQASMPGGILSWFFICLLVATAGYAGTFVAQFHGAGSRRDAAAAYGQGLWITLICLPIILASIPFGHLIFAWCAHAPAVAAAERTYYDILQIGGIFCVLGAVLGGYFAGIGRTRLVGAATIAGNLLNVLLDWVFVFGKWGCPEWGIAGAGWATVIAAAVPCVILGGVTFFDPALRGVRYLAAVRPQRKLLVRIVRYGFPSGLHQFLDVASFTIFVMLIGRLDAMSSAVSNIVFAINHLSFAPLMGLGQGAAMLVGTYQGAHDSAASIRATRSCLVLGFGYIVVFACVLLFFPDVLMDLFRAEDSSFDPVAFRALGRTLMLILLSWAFFDATSLVVGGALKGAGDTKFVMWSICVISLMIWLPAVFLVMSYAPTVTNMWLTMPFYCCICASTCVFRFLRGRWKRHRLVDDLVRR